MHSLRLILPGLATTALISCGNAPVSTQNVQAAPVGQYRLDWQKLDATTAKVRVRGSDGSLKQDAGTIYVEFSTRDGKLRGCALSDVVGGNAGPSVSGNCRVDKDTVILEMGQEHDSLEGLTFELKPTSAAGAYDGSLYLRHPLIPGGKVAFASAQMAPMKSPDQTTN